MRPEKRNCDGLLRRLWMWYYSNNVFFYSRQNSFRVVFHRQRRSISTIHNKALSAICVHKSEEIGFPNAKSSNNRIWIT